jgi:endonuclease YncB( thermonuclease family)
MNNQTVIEERCNNHILFLDYIKDIARILHRIELTTEQKLALFYKELHRNTRIVFFCNSETPHILCKKTCCRKKQCPQQYRITLTNNSIETTLDSTFSNTYLSPDEVELIYETIDRETHQMLKKELQLCCSLRKLVPTSVDSVISKGQWIPARLLKVIDGDTISVAVIVANGEALKVSVRINGVDCPEKSRASEKEIRCSNLITHYLKQHLDTIVQVKFLKVDKWGGRWIGMVQYLEGQEPCVCGCGFNGVCLGQYVLSNGLAKPYKGDKKTPWSETELDNILLKF